MRTISISQEVRIHLDLHFGTKKTGSKFFCESPEEFLTEAMRMFPKKYQDAQPDPDGRYRISLTFPNEIGVGNVVSIDELTDEEKGWIEIVDRQGSKVRSVKTDRVIPTHECQIILSENWQLITMSPGDMAPPLPDSPDIHDDYWDNHVFIEPINK